MPISRASGLANLAFFAVCTVFVSILPIGVETQPILAVLLVLICFKMVIAEAVHGDMASLLLGVLVIVIVFYSIIGMFLNGIDSALNAFKLLIPLGFYFAVKRIPLKLSAWAVNSMVIIHLLILVLIAIGYGSVFKVIFERYSYGAGGDEGSGISFLAQEPGYAGMYLFAIIVSIWCATELKHRKALSLFFVALLILTQSVFSFVLALVSIYMIFGKRLLPVLLAVLPVLFFILPEDGRVVLFINAIKNVDPANLVVSAIIVEPSGTTRLLKNIPSAYYGLTSVHGYGMGSFSTEFPKIAQDIELLKYNPVLSDLYYGATNGKVSPDSFLSLLMFELGWFSFLYIFAIGLMLRSCLRNLPIFFTALSAAILFSLQSQITNPILLYALVLLSGYSMNKFQSGPLREPICNRPCQ
jgi:hypothetical protein